MNVSVIYQVAINGHIASSLLSISTKCNINISHFGTIHISFVVLFLKNQVIPLSSQETFLNWSTSDFV